MRAAINGEFSDAKNWTLESPRHNIRPLTVFVVYKQPTCINIYHSMSHCRWLLHIQDRCINSMTCYN